VRILSEECHGFGARAARDYLSRRHQLKVGWDLLREAMEKATLIPKNGNRSSFEAARPALRRAGELVHWQTWKRNWFGPRNEKPLLITMVDAATHTLTARFVRHASHLEHLGLLKTYLERYGSPVAFAGSANLFQSSGSRSGGSLSPTQIGRALSELKISWIAEGYEGATGDLGRSLDALADALQTAGTKTLEAANSYLDHRFVPWWNGRVNTPSVKGANAHRPLDGSHDLDSILSSVEFRRVGRGSTIRFAAQRYRMVGADGAECTPGQLARIEVRLDGSICMTAHIGGSVSQICGPDSASQPLEPMRVVRKERTKLGRAWRANHGTIALGDTPIWRAAQIDRVRVSDRLD
jgi:hypothetical protein